MYDSFEDLMPFNSTEQDYYMSYIEHCRSNQDRSRVYFSSLLTNLQALGDKWAESFNNRFMELILTDNEVFETNVE